MTCCLLPYNPKSHLFRKGDRTQKKVRRQSRARKKRDSVKNFHCTEISFLFLGVLSMMFWPFFLFLIKPFSAWFAWSPSGRRRSKMGKACKRRFRFLIFFSRPLEWKFVFFLFLGGKLNWDFTVSGEAKFSFFSSFRRLKIIKLNSQPTICCFVYETFHRGEGRGENNYFAIRNRDLSVELI